MTADRQRRPRGGQGGPTEEEALWPGRREVASQARGGPGNRMCKSPNVGPLLLRTPASLQTELYPFLPIPENLPETQV